MNAFLTDRELDAVSAWWVTGSVVDAATMLGLSRNTVKNQLYLARIRTSCATNVILVQKHLKLLRSADELAASHKKRQAAAA